METLTNNGDIEWNLIDATTAYYIMELAVLWGIELKDTVDENEMEVHNYLAGITDEDRFEYLRCWVKEYQKEVSSNIFITDLWADILVSIYNTLFIESGSDVKVTLDQQIAIWKHMAKYKVDLSGWYEDEDRFIEMLKENGSTGTDNVDKILRDNPEKYQKIEGLGFVSYCKGWKSK